MGMHMPKNLHNIGIGGFDQGDHGGYGSAFLLFGQYLMIVISYSKLMVHT